MVCNPAEQHYGELELRETANAAVWNGDINIDVPGYLLGYQISQLNSATLFIGKTVLKGSGRVVRGNVFATKKYTLYSMWNHPYLGGSQSRNR